MYLHGFFHNSMHMNMKRNTIFIIIFLCTGVLFAQKKQKNTTILQKGSVKEKFEFVIDESYSYQDNKVIKKNWMNTLKYQVLDSIKVANAAKLALNKKINDQVSVITKLESTITNLNADIQKVNQNKEQIGFLGIDLKKSDFKSIFWTIVIILSFSLAFFIYKFKNSNVVTKTTKLQLEDIEKEYENHRKVALEREQKVMRKLQDEINKNKVNS